MENIIKFFNLFIFPIPDRKELKSKSFKIFIAVIIFVVLVNIFYVVEGKN